MLQDSYFPPQIRLLNNSTDLIEVANLIETCFSDHMDADGYEYLNHIRRAARDDRFLRWIPGSGEMASYPLHGYVWVENSRIIGNITLIPVYVQDHWNYLIVNVAVHPDHRHLGIARQLTLKGLEHIQQHGASSAWLQVRDDNPNAISLYESLGFIEKARRATWISNLTPIKKENFNELSIFSRKDNEWPIHRDWLKRCYPPEVSWHLPISINKFKPSIFNKIEYFFSELTPKHWTCYWNGKPVGFITLEPTRQSADLVWLALSPDHEELAARALLNHIRQDASPYRPITVNYAGDFAESVFASNGFTRQNTLIWMEVTFQSTSIPFVKNILDRLVTL